MLLDAGFVALDPIKIAQVGGTSLALSLLLVLIALWRGWLELGTSSRREVEFWKNYAKQGWDERDAYRLQVEQRQSVVDQALELARVLKDFQSHSRPRRDGG